MKRAKRKQRGRGSSSLQQPARPIHKSETEAERPIGRAYQGRELMVVISSWFLLAAAMWLLAKGNLSVPGLYYDEAIFGGMAKDFLTGHIHGPHMPGGETAQLFGAPFPIFVQTYLGALKSWMLMPSFRFFGYTVAVLRASNLFWGSLSLLFLMLATWRWLGLRIALLAGLILAFDPAHFFLCVLDWGAAVPSFFCRSVAFYLAVRWWQQGQARYIFLAAFFAGLGFFNKIDFAVLLIALSIAGIFCCWGTLLPLLKKSGSTLAIAAAGFLLGAGPMLLKFPLILGSALSGKNPSAPGELNEKFHTLWAMFNGSYFYRLMNVGGVFEQMFSEPLNWFPVFGACVIVAGIVCVLKSSGKTSDRTVTQAGLFFLFSGVGAILGVILLPGAVRIHHSILVYPLPQLMMATAAILCWQTSGPSGKRRAIQVAVCLAVFTLLASQVWAIRRTQNLVTETGGRGRWSENFDDFCRTNRDRADLTIVSLDWGFNEQLNFLTDAPKLIEPFWTFGQNPPALPADPQFLYLAHPEQYALFPFSSHYLNEARAKNTGVEIHPYLDRQGQIAFYTIQFLQR